MTSRITGQTGSAVRQFADAVRQGLTMTPRRLDPKYFYDDLGSALFNAICRLPWYPITRAELAMLGRHAGDIIVPASPGAPGAPRTTIVELGCGSGEKLLALVEPCRDRVAGIHLVDISRAALDETARRLDRAGFLDVTMHCGAYEDGLEVMSARANGRAPMLVLFLGSNIGNFDPDAARRFLAAVAGTLRPGDGLLLGADLVKPERQLIEAYDDPLGVTAAFNLNLLQRINRELGGTFDLSAWRHRAAWNAAESRVEMHLDGTRPQSVHVEAAALDLRFATGQGIWTESSYKYDPDAIVSVLARAGFGSERQWIDDRARFALTLARV
jgi:dimethylhistidine N-methyltransferase